MPRSAIRMVARVALAAGTAAYAPAGGAAELTPVSQERYAHAENFSQTVEGSLFFEETETAPDFSPFSSAIDGIPPEIPISLDVIAAQDSSIGVDRLSATGSAIADPAQAFQEVHIQETESVYRVEFDLAEPTAYALGGRLDLEARVCEVWTRGHIRLSGPAGVVAEVSDEILTYPHQGAMVSCSPPCVASHPLLDQGVLPPGRYTLEAVAESYGEGGVGFPLDQCEEGFVQADFDVQLDLGPPPVPAVPLPGAALAALGVAGLARRLLRSAGDAGSPHPRRRV